MQTRVGYAPVTQNGTNSKSLFVTGSSSLPRILHELIKLINDDENIKYKIKVGKYLFKNSKRNLHSIISAYQLYFEYLLGSLD